MTALRVGLLGCGVVGTAVARNLVDRADELSSRVGAPVALARVAVRDVAKPRAVALPHGLMTNNALCVATDMGVDVVIEVIGGLNPARELVTSALRVGKHVVTANKQLVARHGDELQRVAAENGVSLHFEASVCGAIPIVRVLRAGLAGDRVLTFDGIVNGTTNYVLSAMAARGCTLDEAVREAQAAGYAEAAPDDDLSGRDAAAKAALLARLSFGVPVSLDDVRYEGIDHVTPELVAEAAASGAKLKLVASGKVSGQTADVSVRVRALDPAHALFDVDGVDNAVVVTTECAGRLMLKGAGAGGDPTASAVLGDLLTALRRVVDDAA